MLDYRAIPTNNHYPPRPPLSSSKWHRTPSVELDDRERATRSSSLQRPASYLPAFDRI